MDEIRAAFGFEKAEEILIDYVLETMTDSGEFTEDKVKIHIKIKYSVTLSQTNKTRINGLDEKLRGRQILSLYLLFFPVYVKNTEDKIYKELEVKTLKSYKPPLELLSGINDIQGYENIASKIAKSINYIGPLIHKITDEYETKFTKAMEDWSILNTYARIGLTNYEPLFELNDLLARIWLENAKNFFEAETYEEVVILLKAFDSSITPLFKLKSFSRQLNMENYNYDPCNMQNRLTHFEDVCKTDEANRHEECAKYCQTIEKFQSVEQVEKVARFIGMGFDELSHPFGAFQHCNNSSSDFNSCWKKVVTDMGVCFATNMARVEDNWRVASRRSPNLYILFGDGRFDIGRIVEKYDSAQLGLSEGRSFDVYIIPPYQTAIESILSDKKLLLINGFYHVLLGPYGRDRTNDIKVEVESLMTSTDEFKRISVVKKHCQHQEERRVAMTGSGSEADCFLECTWKIAVRKCGCVPWYIADKFPDSSLCELYGNKCFKKFVEDRYWEESEALEKCHPECPLDCERITYKPIITRFDSITSHTELVKEYLESSKGNTSFEKNLERISDSLKHVYYRNGGYDNTHLIQMYATGKLAQEVMRTATMTTVDLISNVGGTLGLFCGFSIISLAEVVYCVVNFAWKQLARRKNHKKRGTKKT